MSYLCRVISSDFGGMAKITQICTIDTSGLGNCSGYLDGSDPYNGTGQEGYECSVQVYKSPNPTGTANEMNLDDSPDSNTTFGAIWMNDSFTNYIMFNPDPNGSGIYVTLGIVTWGVNASVDYPDTTIIQSVLGPTGPDGSNKFPVWTNTRQH
jgi:hypothetical protein